MGRVCLGKWIIHKMSLHIGYNKFAGYMQEQDTDIEAVKTSLGDNANAKNRSSHSCL